MEGLIEVAFAVVLLQNSKAFYVEHEAAVAQPVEDTIRDKQADSALLLRNMLRVRVADVYQRCVLAILEYNTVLKSFPTTAKRHVNKALEK